uniref:Cuticle protein 6 n=1 Tax=Strigamia maritima TaxID=126957 RepID=T1IS71_STRMM
MYTLILTLVLATVNADVLIPAPHHYTFASASAGAVPSPLYKISIPVVASNQYQAQDISGQYSFGYSTGNGIVKNEERALNGDISGGYAYISPEGQKVSITYTAGENGFMASGDAIPKSVKPTQDVAEATRSHLKAKAEAEAKAAAESKAALAQVEAVVRKVESEVQQIEAKPKAVSLVAPASYAPLPYAYSQTLPGHFVSYTSSAPNVKYVVLQPEQTQYQLQPQPLEPQPQTNAQPQPQYVYSYKFSS